MKQKIMAVCDLEESYAFRMADYITDRAALPFRLHLYTRTEPLLRSLERGEIYVLLISESALEELDAPPSVPHLFILQEHTADETTDAVPTGIKDATAARARSKKKDKAQNDVSGICISKYQSPENIVRQMTEYMAEADDWSGSAIQTDAHCKMIGIYSPVRRCLQTSFALTLGQLLATEHKVLYLNFETYSGFGQLLQREFQADLLDMVYYFECAKEKFALRLPSLVQNINGLDYVPPGQMSLDLQGISGEKWLELLQTLAQCSAYEYLILDLTDSMNGLFTLLANCHKIYTITKEDGFAMAKMKQYEEILQLNDMDNIAGRTVKCKFPFFDKLPGDISLMTHGDLATYVKRIIQEDLYETTA